MRRRKFKKSRKLTIIIIVSILLLAGITFALVGLSSCNTHNMVTVTGTIIAKFDRQEYNEWESWFWEHPVYETRYYFIVQYRTNTYEINIDSKTYYSLNIGDNYQIKVKSEAI